MAIQATRASADALHAALDQARADPRVLAISRSLGLDLSTASLWLRVRGRAEANLQEVAMDNLKLEALPDPVTGSGRSHQRYAVDAIAAYATVSRI